MRCVFIGPVASEFRDLVTPQLDSRWVVEDKTPEEGVDALIVSRYSKIDPQIHKPRLIQFIGAGWDGSDLTWLPSTTTVCNVHEHETAIAEYVFTAMLSWTRDLRACDGAMRRGDWSASVVFCGRPQLELKGQTLVLVGYGKIGRAIARCARPFGMRVVALNRTMQTDWSNVDEFRPLANLARTACEADFLVISLSLTSETRGLINRDILRAMKPSGVLINVGRGPLVDEAALFDALRYRLLRGAVLDVWWNYPKQPVVTDRITQYPFDTLDNVIMTPHISGWTEGTLKRRSHVIAENLNRLITGRPLLNVVVKGRA